MVNKMHDFYIEAYSEPELAIKSHDIVIFQKSESDFQYWSGMPYWSIHEGITLLLGKEPDKVTPEMVRNCEESDDDEVEPYLPKSLSEWCKKYSKIAFLASRSIETREIKKLNMPADFIAWARVKGFEIPEALSQQMAARREALKQWALENRDADQDREIIALKETIQRLQERIIELERLQWTGFDKNSPFYARELVIALECYKAVSENYKPGVAVKKQLTDCLKEHYPNLPKVTVKRIVQVSNWNKEGGSPLTPTVRSL